MKKSVLEAEREAAAFTSDIGSSLEDSEASSHDADSVFDVDDIIAQRTHEEENQDVVQHLAKFTDYPLHRSQWLYSHLCNKGLLDSWRVKRRELGMAKLERISEKKTAQFNAAVKKADAQQRKRRQKRRHMREQLQQSAARGKGESLKQKEVAKAVPSSPLDHTAPANGKAMQAASFKKKSRVVVDSEDENEFVPMAMSSDEDVSMATSSSSSDNVPLIKRRARSRSRGTRLRTSAKVPSKPSSPQQRRKLGAKPSLSVEEPSYAAAPLPIPVRRPSMPKGPRDPGPTKIVNEPKQPQRKVWDTQGKHFGTLHFRAVAEKRGRAEGTPDINDLQFVNGRPAGISTKSADTTSAAPAHNNPNRRRESGQRLLLEVEPEDETRSTMTAVALQSYEEDKIPMTCYDWKHTTCIHGAEGCRFLHRKHGPDGNLLAVTNWKGEIPPKYRGQPETCWSWFCEGTCRYSDADCVYAHKNTGRLKQKSIDPHIECGSAKAREITREIGGEFKYPNITCVHWLMDTKGCLKSSSQCEFAHRNTGMLGNTTGEPFKPIDPNIKPANPPQTCFFWLRGFTGCNKRAEDCKLAHDNTGYIRVPGRQLVLQIDTKERPKYDPALQVPSMPAGPVSTGVPARDIPACMKTCFFWNMGSCNEPEDLCRFVHRYTGVVARAPPRWVAPPGFQLKLRLDPVPTQHHVDSPDLMQLDEPIGELVEERVRQSLDTREDGCRIVRHADSHVEDSRILSPQENRSDVKSAGGSFVVKDKHEKRVLQQENGNNTKSNGQLFDVKRKVEEAKPVELESAGQALYIKHQVEGAMLLDLDEMLRCNGDQHEDVVAGPNALILYDPELYKEQPRLLERWLAVNYMKVFNTRRMGFYAAWDGFREVVLDGGSGIIITPPDFEDYASLPGFGDVLRGTVCLWSLGHQPVADYNMWDPKAPKDRPYDRFAIFPHGGIIYITDDVFLKEPQLALTIFEHFSAKIEAGRNVDSDVIPGMYINDGILLWRIGVRPELMKWISDICVNHQAEIEGGDLDYTSLEKLYILLHDSGYCEPDGHFDPPADNRRLDFFPVISMRQDLAEDVGLYYEARKKSQHEANTDMAHHYSGLVVMERRNYRHYFVVHTSPEMVDWKETITNIEEVITPEKCIEYFEQAPKGSRFDGYEWSYPTKRTDSVTALSSDQPVQNSQPFQNNQKNQKNQLVQNSKCGDCGLNSAECPCGYV
ncbi:hypothetical protein PMIN07_010671 [Paraphaeosphaeria minitans]